MAAIVDQNELCSRVRLVADDSVDEFVDLIVSNVLITALSLGIVGNERFIEPIWLVTIFVLLQPGPLLVSHDH